MNVDGIKKIKNKTKPQAAKARGVDSVIKTKAAPAKPFHLQAKQTKSFAFFTKLNLQRHLPASLLAFTLLIGFGGGMWAALSTTKSAADGQVLGAQTSVPAGKIALDAQNASLGPAVDVSNQALYSMTLAQLENYLNQSTSTTTQIDNLADRKSKLKAYLEEKNSPLAQIVDTIAGLKHWKLVLAVANSESSLGKHCYNNNCSGIGVDPSNPHWRNYKSKAEWAEDLDRLIEKRYNNWTLENMNGVYNSPGSKNWVAAATQVLDDLKERGIE